MRSLRYQFVLRGSLVLYYLWLQGISGWLLSAILVAGLTGLMRSDSGSEARCACSVGTGHRPAARTMLADIYNWFTGLRHRRPKGGEVLLDELAG